MLLSLIFSLISCSCVQVDMDCVEDDPMVLYIRGLGYFVDGKPLDALRYVVQHHAVSVGERVLIRCLTEILTVLLS